jgi:hypothetical protein
MTQLEPSDQRAKVRFLRAAADERQRRLRPLVLDNPERADRGGDVVEGVEVARRRKTRTKRIALAIAEALQIDDVGDDGGVDAEAAKDVDQETRRNDVAIHARDGLSRDGRSPQVIRASPPCMSTTGRPSARATRMAGSGASRNDE